ncbi:acyl-CoA dehydrogenase family protein [Mycobacterium syngnathidarum]
MDTALTDTQQVLVDLARTIFVDAARRSDDRAQRTDFDGKLWAALASAGLLGTGVPAELGGLGLSFVEIGLILEEAGRTAAAAPLSAVLGTAAMLLAEFGTAEQHSELLMPFLAGEAIPTVALIEESSNPLVPNVIATTHSGGWLLNGEKVAVLAGPIASHFIISARIEGLGVRLFVVPRSRPGVGIRSQRVTDGEAEGHLVLMNVQVERGDVLGPIDGDSAFLAGLRFAAGAVCAETAGLLSVVVGITAEYVSERKQFGRPIGSFQAVGQRLSDAFSASWTAELTARQAAWRIAHTDADGIDSVNDALRVAKYWSASGASKVVRAAHHLHGGIGLDRDYRLARYTMRARRLGMTFGGESEHLSGLGRTISTPFRRTDQELARDGL